MLQLPAPAGGELMARKSLAMLCLLLWMIQLAACSPDQLAQQPSMSGTEANQASAPEAISDEWQTIGPSMELRKLLLSADGNAAQATVLRFDPQSYKVSVKYDVMNPGSVREWFNALKPVAVINGGYFDDKGRPTALVIFDGIRRGESYTGFGGMIAINEQEQVELRSLRQQPYDPAEPLRQAMQSAPMLIQPGGELSQLDPDEDRSRRSVIARDRQGRILLIACSTPSLTLPALASALHQSDLDLDAALNLDGGRSTGLYVQTAEAKVAIDSIEKLPLVLVVEQL